MSEILKLIGLINDLSESDKLELYTRLKLVEKKQPEEPFVIPASGIMRMNDIAVDVNSLHWSNCILRENNE